MNRSMLDFFADKGGEDPNRQYKHIDHGGTLQWPGSPDGYPYRGESAPITTQAEANALPHKADYKCRLFEMWDPAQAEAYRQVMEWATHELFHVRVEDRRWIEARQHYTIWLEWCQIYATAPTRGRNYASNPEPAAVR